MAVRRPISFIATAQPDRAATFYRDVLGLDLLENSPFALVFRDGENMLRVQVVAEVTPVPYTVHGWQVTDIAQEIRGLSARGVTFLHFDQLPQDATGVWTTPDGARIAWFHDPCGNTLSLTQLPT